MLTLSSSSVGSTSVWRLRWRHALERISSDRDAFEAHHQRVRTDSSVVLRAIGDSNGLVGKIGSFTMGGPIGHLLDRPESVGRRPRIRGLDAFLNVE